MWDIGGSECEQVHSEDMGACGSMCPLYRVAVDEGDLCVCQKSLTGRTAARKIHSASAWWLATSDGTAEKRHG